ncbi:MAG: hypothetical protein KDD50_08235 [Bdellovibrionales bacterium]|nr:hypothetical protein [Bdellovibrionales bacterium]
MKKLLIAAIFALPMLAHAHGDVFEMTEMSVSEALRKFQTEETTSTIQAYRGVRAWPSGAEIKVRVYYGAQDSFLYSCEMDHATGAEEKIVCQKN